MKKKYVFTKNTQKIHNLVRSSKNLLFKNWKCNNVEVKTHLMGRLRLYFCSEFLDPWTCWRKSTSEIICNEISILFSFPHVFAFINQGSSRIRNKVILTKYSRPIGMFPATHRLRTTGLGRLDVPFLSELSRRPEKYGTGRHIVQFFQAVPFYFEVPWKLYVTHPLCMADTCSRFACAMPPVDIRTIISYQLI
jgi:hypothetical protein